MTQTSSPIDALTADRRVHAGPSQVDTAPISLPFGHLLDLRPLGPDALRLAIDTAGNDVGFSVVGPPSAVAILSRLLAFLAPAQSGGMAPSTGHPWFDVLQEQRRQIHVEGFVPEHDDDHTSGELAAAAACYAMAGMLSPAERTERRVASLVPRQWPFEREWWRPTTPREDLVKAGAFLLAELSRLDRLAQRSAA